MTYEVIGWYKEAVKDNWEKGETGQRVCFSGFDRFSAETVDELVKRLQDMFWCDYCQIAMNDSDEIVLERMEDDDGDRVSKDSIRYTEWILGQRDLWIARYHFRVEYTVRKPAELEEKEFDIC